MPNRRRAQTSESGGKKKRFSRAKDKEVNEHGSDLVLVEAIDWGTQNVAMAYGFFHNSSRDHCNNSQSSGVDPHKTAIQSITFEDGQSHTLTSLAFREDGSYEWGSSVPSGVESNDFTCCFENLKLASIEDKKTADLRREHVEALERIRPQIITYKTRSKFNTLLENTDRHSTGLEQVVRDSAGLATVFLSLLNDFTLDRIAQAEAGGHYKINACRKETGIAVPALTEAENVDKILSIVDKAGFQNLNVVSEPAAAALYLFRLERDEMHSVQSKGVTDPDRWTLENDQPLVVADVGHGTADYTSYSVQSEVPFRVREIVQGSGTFYGGKELNQRFRDFVREKIELNRHGGVVEEALKRASYCIDDLLDTVEREFEKKKKFFKGKIENQGMRVNLYCGLRNFTLYGLNIIKGILELTVEEVEQVFAPVIANVIFETEQQVSRIRDSGHGDKPAVVAFVGGTTDSVYFRNRLNVHFSSKDVERRLGSNPRCWFPVKERKTIVSKGTLLATLYKGANSETIARRSYGIVQDIPYEDLEDSSRKTIRDARDGIRYVPNCVRWFFRVGDKIRYGSHETISGHRYIWLDNNEEERPNDIVEIIAWSDAKLPDFVANDHDEMGEKGAMTITLTDKELDKFPIHECHGSPSGRRYRYVEYRVRMRYTQLRLIFEFIVPRTGIFPKTKSSGKRGGVEERESESDFIIRRAEAYGQTIAPLGLHESSGAA